MRRVAILALLLGGCATPRVEPEHVKSTWALHERPAIGLDCGSGEARMSDAARILVVGPLRPEAPERVRLVPEVTAPPGAGIGEEFWIEVRLVKAREQDAALVRILPDRPGLRLPDGNSVHLRGTETGRLRAVAESAGPATFTAHIE